MSNYIVDGADLTSVANAIRTKGSTSASLAFPADFISAINAISGGGSTSGVLTFDFTQSLEAQEASFFKFVLSNATRDSSGLHLTGGSHKATLSGLDLTDCVIEIDIGTLNKATGSSTNGRFVAFTSDGSSTFGWRNTGQWAIYSGSTWTDTGITDANYFANSTVRLELSGVNTVSVYKGNTLIVQNAGIGGAGQYISFGSTSTAFYNATITGCRLYSSEAYALKVLLGS